MSSPSFHQHQLFFMTLLRIRPTYLPEVVDTVVTVFLTTMDNFFKAEAAAKPVEYYIHSIIVEVWNASPLHGFQIVFPTQTIIPWSGLQK